MEPAMSDPRILAERDGTIVTLTLNRPDKLNAIDGAMLDALDDVLGEIEGDREVRAVILTGAGRAFSAGADIKEWTALTPLEFGRRWGLRGHALFDRLAALPPPVIAAINGIAFGGGLELALCADIRIAGDQARLGLPEVTIAALPGWGGTQRLPRLIGPARAKELATQIAANAPVAVQASKRLIDAALPVTPAATLETQAGALSGATEDAREGRASFLERRPPRYQGR